MDEVVTRARLPRRERRAQLLEAASTVFADRGYHSASMDDIAVAGGVSKPVLYQHFASKLELYLALLDLHCEAIVDTVLAALGASTDNNEDRVKATIHAFYGLVASDDPAFHFVFGSDLTGDDRVAERIRAMRTDLATGVAATIADQTGLSRDEAMLSAWTMVGLAESSARAWRTTDIDQERAQNVISTLAWRGISGFPVQPPTDAHGTQ